MFMGGKVHVTLPHPPLVGRDNPHVRRALDLRKHHLLRTGPHQSGGVFQPWLRCAAQHGDDPRVPEKLRAHHGVRDPRAVRGKHRPHLREVVVRQLDRLAIRKHLDVNLAGPEERRGPANERQHAPVGRQCGLADRIGQPGELDPLGSVGCRSRAARPDGAPNGQHRQRGCRNRSDLPPVPATLCPLDRFPGVHDILQPSRRILVQTTLHQLTDARRSRGGQNVSNQARAPAPLRSCPANRHQETPASR